MKGHTSVITHAISHKLLGNRARAHEVSEAQAGDLVGTPHVVLPIEAPLECPPWSPTRTSSYVYVPDQSQPTPCRVTHGRPASTRPYNADLFMSLDPGQWKSALNSSLEPRAICLAILLVPGSHGRDCLDHIQHCPRK